MLEIVLRGEFYRDFFAGDNSARRKFRTHPKKSREKFRTAQILSAMACNDM